MLKRYIRDTSSGLEHSDAAAGPFLKVTVGDVIDFDHVAVLPMSTVLATYQCDVCGKPATHAVRDSLRHEAPGAQFIEFSPIGSVRIRCDDHPTESREERTQLPRV